MSSDGSFQPLSRSTTGRHEPHLSVFALPWPSFAPLESRSRWNNPPLLEGQVALQVLRLRDISGQSGSLNLDF